MDTYAVKSDTTLEVTRTTIVDKAELLRKLAVQTKRVGAIQADIAELQTQLSKFTKETEK